MKSILLLTAGTIVGVTIVVACSDDSPGDADAAVCDCPAAEAPITASRVHRVDGDGTAGVNGVTFVAAVCPVGELFLSGSCYIDVDNTAREVFVQTAGATPAAADQEARAWECHFQNDSLTATATVRAQALCLRPLQ
ncbi:MAG: hypothetical protein IPL61_09465 [Myxococcales bacterium]|nr:hypothetical protein [Myxococcales bacterium]